MSTQIRIGYAQVSTGGQRHAVSSGRSVSRPDCFSAKMRRQPAARGASSWRSSLEFMTAGDTLVVPALDRLSRSLQDLITTVGELRRREVGFTSLHENLDTTTPGGRLVFHAFAALAEFIRELIVSGTREGLTAARARARPSVVTPEIVRAARDMLPNPDASVTAIARLLGVSPGTLYNHIPGRRFAQSGQFQ